MHWSVYKYEYYYCIKISDASGYLRRITDRSHKIIIKEVSSAAVHVIDMYIQPSKWKLVS